MRIYDGATGTVLYEDITLIFSGLLYHITGINPDLSVPNSEPYSWEIHNTWLTQICEGPPSVEENKNLELK